MNELLIGWAEENFTPKKKAKLAGQFFERISEYVETPITATAMAVESDGEQMILCSCDLVSLNDDLVATAKQKIAKICDVSPEKVLFSATHTHTSILYKAAGAGSTVGIIARYMPEGKSYKEKVTAENQDVLTTEEAVEFISDKMALAVTHAWENRKKAYFSNAFGRAAVGMCRRVVYDDGSAKMWGDTNTANFVKLEGGNDSGIELMYTFDNEQKLTGVVANVACPAQVLEQRSFISADYWGEVKTYLRKKYGEDLFVLGLCAPAGDQCPRDLVRWVNPETPIDDPNVHREHYIERRADPSMYDLKGCRLVGKRIANEISSVYEEIEELKDSAVLKHKVLKVELPLRRVSRSEYQNAVRELEYFAEKCKDKDWFDYADNAAMHIHAGTVARYELQQSKDLVPIDIHIIRFGDVAIATNPFELFLNYGNQMRARSKAKQTFLIQLAEGGPTGYLPTEDAERGSHYSAYVSGGQVGHQGGDMLVRKTVEEINEMFAD